MDFWNFMIKKDDIILSFLEHIRVIKRMMSADYRMIFSKNNKLERQGEGKDLYLVFNAPSVKSQDLTVLEGLNIMFVNRGFKHPLFRQLKPKYHVFCDPKMINGIWPISWIDEIVELSPNITIILPASWYNNPLFDLYKKKNIKFYWQTETLPFYNLGVSGSCFAFAIAHKFKNIYFTGFDATGIGYEMVKTANSHFYGNDEELDDKTTKQFAIDLLMHSRHLHDLNRLAYYCQINNINIINLTNGGLLDMFPRENLIPKL